MKAVHLGSRGFEPPAWVWYMPLIDKGFTPRQIEEDFTHEDIARYLAWISARNEAEEMVLRKNRGRIGQRVGNRVVAKGKTAW